MAAKIQAHVIEPTPIVTETAIVAFQRMYQFMCGRQVVDGPGVHREHEVPGSGPAVGRLVQVPGHSDPSLPHQLCPSLR
jgi:hypothetical protein